MNFEDEMQQLREVIDIVASEMTTQLRKIAAELEKIRENMDLER